MELNQTILHFKENTASIVISSKNTMTMMAFLNEKAEMVHPNEISIQMNVIRFENQGMFLIRLYGYFSPTNMERTNCLAIITR